ncbi:MAG: phage/plasmid primase, P4 family [Coleofasciculus sp. G3-WIS-01]|uniref:phage/plasmid primase, P4 family n=1 Tax=Coleofasciculus sp. G3-WIS-01 TaxID=3069528 RepID=UPI0032FA9CB2
MLNDDDLRELMNSGLTETQALQTGHFSADKEWSKNNLGIDHDGLIFNYSSPNGDAYLINGKPFNRIKPKDWGEKTDAPKYLSPRAMGNRPYFSRLGNMDLAKDANTPVILVEGEKKADCLNAHGIFTVGLAGVYGWLDKSTRSEEIEYPPAQLIEDEIEEQESIGKMEESRLLPELENEINWKGRKVYIAFDSDIVDKYQVKDAIAKLAKALRNLGAFPKIARIPNEIDGSKNGPDDFIVRHGSEAFNTILGEATPALSKKGDLMFKQDPDRLSKILIAWTVLKDTWRYRPGIGFYRWESSHWALATSEEFDRDLILFQDAQKWRQTTGLEVVLKQLKCRLLVGESLWNPDRLLVFQNGTLDCVSGNFMGGHVREDFCTTCIDYEWDMTAECPTWKRFLASALDGDSQSIELIRAFIKWILTPKPSNRKADIEKSLDIIGAKGTGKGTFLDVITELVGRGNYAAITCDTFNSPNSLSSMLDKKVSIDFDAQGILKNVGMFNRVVSNEPISIRYLYENPVESRLRTCVIRAYNQYLDTPSGSEGLDRRIVAISFSNRPKAVDIELTEKLRQELAGIFAWAWLMPLKTAKQTIMQAGNIENVRRTSAERFEANNSEYLFLAESFPQGNPKAKAGDLYNSYVDWAKDAGYTPKKNRKFFEAIQRIGAEKSQKTNGCFFYSIPRMDEFSVENHLGLSLPVGGDRKPVTRSDLLPWFLEPETPGGDRTEPTDPGPETPGGDRKPVTGAEPETPGDRPRVGDRVRPKLKLAGKNSPATVIGLATHFIEVTYDHSSSKAILGNGDWEFLPECDDPKIAAKELFSRLKKGCKVKIGKHPYHKEYIGKYGYVRKLKETWGGDLVAFLSLLDGSTDEGNSFTCYLDAATAAQPKKGDRVEFEGWFGTLEKVKDDKGTIKWDSNNPAYESLPGSVQLLQDLLVY